MTPETEDRSDALEDSVRPLPEQMAKVIEAIDRLTDETKAIRQESREDMRALRDELREDVRGLREEFSGFQGGLTQIGLALVGTLFASLIGIIIAIAT